MTIMEKIKETINKLPFNGLVGKIPALAKVAGFANYAACALGVLLLVVVVSVATPNKASAQTKSDAEGTEKTEKAADADKKEAKKSAKPSGKTDKGLNGEWKCGENEVYSFDNGKVTYFDIQDGTMNRGTYKTATVDGLECMEIIVAEVYDFETGKWIAREKLGETYYAYGFPDDDTLRTINIDNAFESEYTKGKYLKELIAKETENAKERKKIKAISVDKLKQQPPAPESDFEVKPTDDSFTAIEITKYKGNNPLVVIPATMQGLPVKWIGDNAFDHNKNLVAVVIPEGVTFVSGFDGCRNLSSVVLPSTLKVIGSDAFQSCSSLKSIDLPAGLLYIGHVAFEHSGLTSVDLPEGLLFIDAGAFSYTPLTSVKLPKSLRLLCDSAFGDCNSLAEIQIPEDHVISYGSGIYDNSWEDWYTAEKTFEWFFSGTKINESIALQKLLKETKTRKMLASEQERIWKDIWKQAE